MEKWKLNWDSYCVEEKMFFITIFSNVFHYSLSILSLFTLFAYLIYKKKWTIVLKESKYFKIITVLLFSNILISIFHQNLIGASFTLFTWGIYFIATYLKTLITKKMMLFILETLCKISIFTAAYIIIGYLINQYLFPFNIGDYSKILFFNENYGGTVFSFIIISSFYMYLQNKEKIYLVIIALHCLLILLAESRGALIGVFTALGLLILVYNRKWIKKYRILIGIIILACIIGLSFLLYRNIIHIEFFYKYIPYRIAIWNAGWHAFLNHPIIGQGTYSYVGYCKDFGSLCIAHSHNIYLETLIIFGVIGTTIITYLAFKYAQKLRKVKALDFDRYMLIIAILTTTAFHGLIDCQILWVQSGFLFIFYLYLVQLKGENNEQLTEMS